MFEHDTIQTQLNRITRLLESKLMPEYFTIKETSEFLKCSESHIRKLTSNGELKFYRIGNSSKSNILIKKSDLLGMVK